MKKRLLSFLAAGVLAIGLLGGCGKSAGEEPLTAESLLKEVQTKTEAIKSMEAKYTMGMTLEADGESIDMSVDMNLQSTKNPEAAHITGKVSTSGMSLDMENYTVVDGDQIVTYTSAMNQWMSMKMPYDKDTITSAQTAEVDLLNNLDSLALQDKTEDVNGKEAYIITGTITGEDVKNLLGSVEDFLGATTASMDLSKLSVDFKYAIDQSTKMPISMDMTFNGLNVSEEDVSVAFKNFTLNMEYTGFDTVDSIAVPQEVIDAAQEISTDGLFVDESELISEIETEETETETTAE